jgi:hypothetical protein
MYPFPSLDQRAYSCAEQSATCGAYGSSEKNGGRVIAFAAVGLFTKSTDDQHTECTDEYAACHSAGDRALECGSAAFPHFVN